MLIRLVYASIAENSVDMTEFKKILETAQKNNAARDLTGMLAFNSKIFLQALEGSRELVNDLYAKLMADPRHRNLLVLKYEEVAERHWNDWSMGFASASSANRALFLKHSMQSVFNPYAMTGDAALNLLMDLSSHVSRMGEQEQPEAEAEKRGFLSRLVS